MICYADHPWELDYCRRAQAQAKSSHEVRYTFGALITDQRSVITQGLANAGELVASDEIPRARRVITLDSIYYVGLMSEISTRPTSWITTNVHF